MVSINVSNRRMIAAFLIGVIALGAWTTFPQTSAHSANVTQERGPFVVRVVKISGSNNFGVVRLNTKTGETSVVANQKWLKHEDATPIPEGDYDISILVTDSDAMTVRIDRATGSTWILRSKTWTKVEEPWFVLDNSQCKKGPIMVWAKQKYRPVVSRRYERRNRFAAGQG
jgi:hypothetical protein